MSKKGNKKPVLQSESKNENQLVNEDDSEIPYRRSLIIQQINDFKMIIQKQDEQIKEGKNEIKNLKEQLANEVKLKNELNTKIFNFERRNNDLESINIFQKNEIAKKDKKINLLNQEIIILKSKRIPSNDFSDQEAKDMIDHLSKELDEKDNKILKLNTKINYLLKEKNLKDNKIDTNDYLQHFNDSPGNDENQQILNTNKQNLKQNKTLNLGQPISKSTNSPSKNSKNEVFEPKYKNNQIKKIKVKKNKNDKQKDNDYEINIDVVAEPKPTTTSREPHYKSKSPPRLNIPSISESQKLIKPTSTTKENNTESNEYEEEEEMPKSSRSAVPQIKNKIIKGRRNTNIVVNNDKKSVERDIKSDDDISNPVPLRNKRITRKKKIIKQKSTNTKENDNKSNPNTNQKNRNNKAKADNDSAANSDTDYSESSQNIKNNKKLIKKVTKRYRRKSISPILSDSDVSEKDEKSKTQPINKNKQNTRNSNDQRRTNIREADEPLPNINFDESEDNDDDSYQLSDNQIQTNNQHPTKTKKITKKIIRKRVTSNEVKNEATKANNTNKESDENKNDTSNVNNKRKNKKRKIIKRKITQVTTNDKAKTSKNLINNNDDDLSSNSLDSNGISTSQKILAIKSMKTNKNNLNDENQKTTPKQSPESQNTAKSRPKTKTRSKAKTINISKQQQNLLNIDKDNQAQLKPQQSQPQMSNNQVKPQNNNATVAARAEWLNNQLFGPQNPNNNNNNNEKIEELLENVVTTNKAIVRNPRRGVNRRPPTILNDI